MTGIRGVRAIDLPPLVAALEGARTVGNLSAGAVASVTHDSRAVRPGSVFVALRGARADGHRFIGAAVAAGARTVVVDAAYAVGHSPFAGAAMVVVPETRRALSRLAAAFYGYPGSALNVTGVTGTNGKTTTTHLIAAILAEAGIPAGCIGTLGARFGGAFWSLENTTPLADELQGLLAEMRDRGAAAVAMEVSSHALVLDRVADVAFATAVLTNVTRDHLDFHESFAAYASAKRRLFEGARRLVFNLDDALGRAWAGEFAAQGRSVVTYGFSPDAQTCATSVVTHAAGSRFVTGGRTFTLRLAGRFNVQNALAALCVSRSMDVDDAVAVRALATFAGVPGRMEHLAGGGIDVLVDYAHTPDALETVLRAARETVRRQLVVVFGCGGDRDRGKRPEMGRIAAEYADRVVVTSDNPRGEEPQAIAAGILRGMPPARMATVELDRSVAIRRAIREASTGDVVVVAGKGHETYQIAGDRARHFDDRDEVRAALALRDGALR